MSAIRLEIETHIVTASATAGAQSGQMHPGGHVKIDERSPTRSFRRAVLSDTERSLAWPLRTWAPAPSTSRCSSTVRLSSLFFFLPPDSSGWREEYSQKPSRGNSA